jgi:hypothetical protein
LRPGDTLLFALERATSTRGRLLQGGILDSVMRENISFVLTGFRAVLRGLFSENSRELFEAIEGQVVKGAR